MGFQGWANGGSANPRTFIAASGTSSYTMLFATEHQLLRTVSPAGAGSVSSADGYYLAGSVLPLTATASSGYQFSGWTGAVSGISNPVSVTMDAPKTATANFNLLTTIASTTAVKLPSPGQRLRGWDLYDTCDARRSSGASCSISFPAIQV